MNNNKRDLFTAPNRCFPKGNVIEYGESGLMHFYLSPGDYEMREVYMVQSPLQNCGEFLLSVQMNLENERMARSLFCNKNL